MGSNILRPILPLNGYLKKFEDNLLEEIVGLEIISLATSVKNKKILDQKVSDMLNLSLPIPGKSFVTSNGKSRLIGLSIDQWLAISIDEETSFNSLINKSLPDKIYTTLQTDAWVVIRLSGPSALKALARICPINLTPEIFLKDDIARTIMEHLGSIVICEDIGSYILMSASSSAKSFLHSLEVSLENVI